MGKLRRKGALCLDLILEIRVYLQASILKFLGQIHFYAELVGLGGGPV